MNDDWERIAEEVVTAHTTTLAFDAVVAVISDFELCLVAREGRLVWLLVSLTYMDVEEGAPPVITATCINISHRKHKEQQVTYQAYHDSLTGLPNRFVFQERLTNALGDRRSVSRGLAIMYLDLDGFKAINDFFGHAAGDAVLKEIGRRLLEVLRSSDTAARLGGDEFAIVLHGVEQPEALSRVATKLLEAIRIPIRYDKFDLGVTASIGVALCPRDGTTKEGLIRKADEAMYLVKSAGKDGFRFASESNA